MKKSKGPSFIQRVLNLFQYEDDEFTATPSSSNKQPFDQAEPPSTDSHPNKRRTSREYNPADKSYESNLDRYKNPSDLHRTGY